MLEIPFRPMLMVCPYLPITSPARFGPWEVAPVEHFTDRWSDAAFRDAALAFIAKFTDARDQPITQPALIGHRKAGMDGRSPTKRQLHAIQLALQFAVLDQNAPWSPQADGWRVATADNADVEAWPLDLEGGYFAIGTGAMAQVLSGGWKLDDTEHKIRGPLELHMPFGVNLDPEVLDATYRVLSAAKADQQRPREAIRVAMTWLSKVWRNTPSIEWEDRVVNLKTGFEGLLGTSSGWSGAARLRQLFDTLVPAGVSVEECRDLVWSPAERERHRRVAPLAAGGGTVKITDLQHWYLALADARNAIIHEGKVGSLVYRRSRSPYNGPFVNIGERVMREAIKVKMAEVGFPELWRSAPYRAAARAMTGQKS